MQCGMFSAVDFVGGWMWFLAPCTHGGWRSKRDDEEARTTAGKPAGREIVSMTFCEQRCCYCLSQCSVVVWCDGVCVGWECRAASGRFLEFSRYSSALRLFEARKCDLLFSAFYHNGDEVVALLLWLASASSVLVPPNTVVVARPHAPVPTKGCVHVIPARRYH